MKKICIILLIGLLLLSSCGQSCPECPKPSSYSDCDDQAMKTRTNYKCEEGTDFQCEEYMEKEQCATEIRTTGRTKLSEMLITPSVEKKVKGIITVELTKAPDETQAVIFAIQKGKVVMEEGLGQNAYIDQDDSDGWSVMYDTTEYENGLYEIAAIVGKEFEKDQPPLDAVIAQILIEN